MNTTAMNTKVLNTPLKTWRLILLAAVLIHLLALAGWQMVRRRQPQPPSLRAADDTPILLQFSREEPEAQDGGSIPLPPAAPLPPPQGIETPGQPAPTGPAAGPGTASTLPGRAEATGNSGKEKVAPSPRAGAARTPARQARAKGVGTPGTPPAAAAPPLALGAGSAARVALEKGLQDARPPAAEEVQGAAKEAKKDAKTEQRNGGTNPGPEGEARSSGGDPGRTSAGGSIQQASPAEQRLWNLARPGRTTAGSREGLPPGVTVRELPLSQARSSGADISHRRLVRLDDGVLLIWLEGSTVWLVRSPLP